MLNCRILLEVDAFGVSNEGNDRIPADWFFGIFHWSRPSTDLPIMITTCLLDTPYDVQRPFAEWKNECLKIGMWRWEISMQTDACWQHKSKVEVTRFSTTLNGVFNPRLFCTDRILFSHFQHRTWVFLCSTPWFQAQTESSLLKIYFVHHVRD